MHTADQNLRILVVTPEVTYVADDMGPESRVISARAGGMGDICAGQIHALSECGIEVHLAIPHYRNLFRANARHRPAIDIRRPRRKLPLEVPEGSKAD